MYSQLNQLVQDEDGQSLIEYSLIASLIAVGCMGAMYLLRFQLITLFTTIKTALTL